MKNELNEREMKVSPMGTSSQGSKTKYIKCVCKRSRIIAIFYFISIISKRCIMVILKIQVNRKERIKEWKRESNE